MKNINTNNILTTRYHHLYKGDAFTLNQLQNKLNDWDRIIIKDNGSFPDDVIASGWNLIDRDEKWDGGIPEIGNVFTLYISDFFSFRTRAVKVLRQKYNLFLVVEEE